MRMIDLPAVLRPRERCLSLGPEHLTLIESLAVILGTGPRNLGALGLAERFVAQQRRSDWRRAVQETPGLGDAQRARLLVVGSWVPVVAPPTETGAPDFRSDAALRVPSLLRRARQEWIGLVSRNAQCDFYWDVLSHGEASGVYLEPRRLAEVAFKRSARDIYLFHNHPSGRREPSLADLKLTQQVSELARTLDFPLRGHAIVTLDHVDWI